MRTILTLLYVLTHLSLFGQEREYNTTRGIKFNLLSPIIGSLSLQYEKSLNPDASFIVGANYFSGEALGIGSRVQGFGLTAEYRFYTGKSYMNGFYLQPFLRYQHYVDRVGTRTVLSVPGTGLLFGYQFVFFKRISIDTYYGPAYNLGTLTEGQGLRSNSYTDELRPIFRGYWMRGGVTFGYLF